MRYLYVSSQILGKEWIRYSPCPVWPLVSADFCVGDVWLLVGIVIFMLVTSITEDCLRYEVRSLIGLTPGAHSHLLFTHEDCICWALYLAPPLISMGFPMEAKNKNSGPPSTLSKGFRGQEWREGDPIFCSETLDDDPYCMSISAFVGCESQAKSCPYTCTHLLSPGNMCSPLLRTLAALPPIIKNESLWVLLPLALKRRKTASHFPSMGSNNSHWGRWLWTSPTPVSYTAWTWC